MLLEYIVHLSLTKVYFFPLGNLQVAGSVTLLYFKDSIESNKLLFREISLNSSCLSKRNFKKNERRQQRSFIVCMLETDCDEEQNASCLQNECERQRRRGWRCLRRSRGRTTTSKRIALISEMEKFIGNIFQNPSGASKIIFYFVFSSS